MFFREYPLSLGEVKGDLIEEDFCNRHGGHRCSDTG
jgi:hypothetical protein